MIEIRIPKEIREYKEKIFLNLTLRQLVCSILAVVVCVPSYIFGSNYVGEETMSWIVMVIGMAVGLVGFYNHNGLTFEKFLIAVLKFYASPINRKYISQNPLDRAMEDEYNELLEELKQEQKNSKKKS